jgi:hypothetical protein
VTYVKPDIALKLLYNVELKEATRYMKDNRGYLVYVNDE